MVENIEVKIIESKAKLFDLRLEGERIQEAYGRELGVLKGLVAEKEKSTKNEEENNNS